MSNIKESTNNKKIFLSGTNGLPGRYGGWDNLLTYLSKKLSLKYKVICHTSKKDSDFNYKKYAGSDIFYIPLSANGIESIMFDLICLIHAKLESGICILMGCSGGIFLPIFRLLGLKIILNPDGEEWKRGKWSKPIKLFLFISFYIGVFSANYVVADHPLILRKVSKIKRKNCFYIPYGGDNALKIAFKKTEEILKNKIEAQKYLFSVCRIEPENNVHLCLELCAKTNYKLVFIGNWSNSNYGKELKNKYKNYDNIFLLDPIYDPRILGSFRSNAKIYFHGHTVGGTNPSLVEAMSLGLNIIAHDNGFNRHTTGNLAHYFSDYESLEKAFYSAIKKDSVPKELEELAKERYLWKDVVGDYEKIVEKAFNMKSAKN
tara:strand:- start:1298 stop:2422 length:1125 start_codon:yes stop_codon:yes gene_type:complete